MPKVFVVPEQNPNAFATGRNPEHAAVAATEGILKLLDDDELSGVMGHELAHVKHRDILTGTIAATFAGAIAMLGQFGRLGVGGGSFRCAGRWQLRFTRPLLWRSRLTHRQRKPIWRNWLPVWVCLLRQLGASRKWLDCSLFDHKREEPGLEIGYGNGRGFV